MKFSLLFFVCLLLTSAAMAAPEITEIRLEESPGTLRQPILKNEFVFRSDGTFDWTEGTLEKPILHRYTIGKSAFTRLAVTLETHGFFDLKPLYDRAMPTDSVAQGGNSIVIGAKRNGVWKHVVNYMGFGPANLWEQEMIIRGFASQYIGLKRTLVPTRATSLRLKLQSLLFAVQRRRQNNFAFALAPSLKTR